MADGIIAAAVIPHVPRIGIEERAPEFAKGMIAGIKEAGESIRALKPDAIVLMSAHWVSTFAWYATGQSVHKGICVAEEAPDLIPGSPYEYKGKPELAEALAEKVSAQDIPMLVNTSPNYNWDYASYVPMHYLDPDAEIPVVTLSTVICSSLDECHDVGQMVADVAKETGLRVVFIASCALSHAVVRGPELWPTPERQEMDHKIIEMLKTPDADALYTYLPTFAKEAVAEMGGRVLGAYFGVLKHMQKDQKLAGTQFGPYAQSSGSGNASICITPQ
ncbi:MAG: extradiol ring-cleavage dioxygenase [Kordiimonas sp.]|nr:extradiol ring-cleavage dioxygenase [Kordiimonas sp.]